MQTNIGRAVSILYDHTRANEWVDQLIESRGLRDEPLRSVVWQRFNVHWPAENRDFIYLGAPAYDEVKKFFQASMTDISDTGITLTKAERSRLPDRSCCTLGRLVYAR